MKKLISLALCMLLACCACAEERFDGLVVAGDTVSVTAPFGGTVKSCGLRVGALVNVNDVIATLSTSRVIATEDGTMFPPMFNSMFVKPCVGIVTKADIATEEQVERAKKHLKNAGAGTIYVTSAVTGEGVDELVKQLHIMD